MVQFCAKRDSGRNGESISVPGKTWARTHTKINMSAYGTQIGSYVREVELYLAASEPRSKRLSGGDIRFWARGMLLLRQTM